MAEKPITRFHMAALLIVVTVLGAAAIWSRPTGPAPACDKTSLHYSWRTCADLHPLDR